MRLHSVSTTTEQQCEKRAESFNTTQFPWLESTVRKGSQFHHLEPPRPWQSSPKENIFQEQSLRRHNAERIWMILWDSIAKHGFIFHCFLSMILNLWRDSKICSKETHGKLCSGDRIGGRRERKAHYVGKQHSQSTYKHKLSSGQTNWRDWIPARRASLPSCFTP